MIDRLRVHQNRGKNKNKKQTQPTYSVNAWPYILGGGEYSLQFVIMIPNAPIDARPTGAGGGGAMQGIGWGFDVIQKFAVKFPNHGQIILI